MSTEAARSERGPRRVEARHATRARVAALVGLAVLLVSACSLNQPPVVGGPAAAPPVRVCGNRAMLTGPSTPPAGAVVLPAGDNSAQIGENWLIQPNTTYWFAPGIHTLGNDEFGQIIPNTNTTWIGAPGAVLDGGRINRYAFTQHATGVTIKFLEIRNFVSPRDQGVVNHDFGANWTISKNWIHHNDGAGLFIGTNNVARHNCLERNGQYGFQGAGGNLLIDQNEISHNNTADWEAHVEGCGCTGGGKFWDVDGATVTNNYVHDNFSVGLWADTNDRAFEFSGNYISGNDAQGIFYEISYNAKITHNTFVRNGHVTGPTNPSFPTAAIYLSESGGDTRVAGGKFSTLDISGNVFTDNWSGVILWENADRFCNSPANTSADHCTLVNTGSVTMTSCSAPTINNTPYYDDCRWKTKNVSVHDNTFNHNPGAIAGCSPSTGCGYNGIFSNWGTFPSWSPYQGQKIQDAITFSQNNVFARNTYKGPWQFMVHDQGTAISHTTWRATPYNQDGGSTITP